MKKFILTLSVIFSVLIAQSAMVKIFWYTPPGGLVNGLQATAIKLYYGSAHLNYTNTVIWQLNSLISNTADTPSFETMSCQATHTDYASGVYVAGLVYLQPFFWGYSFINSNGDESPIIQNAPCAFTVTNRADENLKIVSAPQNLHAQ